MKRLICTLLTTAIMVGAVGCSNSAEIPTNTLQPVSTNTPPPIVVNIEQKSEADTVTEFTGAIELMRKYPQFKIPSLPEGAQNASYSVVDDGKTEPVLKIRFYLNGTIFEYSAMKSDVYSWKKHDLSGLNYKMIESENISTQEILRWTSKENGASHISWFDIDTECVCDLVQNTIDTELSRKTALYLMFSTGELYSIKGTVLEVSDTLIKLRLDGGSTVTGKMGTTPSCRKGEIIEATYSGSFTSTATVVSTKTIVSSKSISGKILSHNKNSVTVNVENGSSIVFITNSETEVTGGEILNNAEVELTYAGSIESSLIAYNITVTKEGYEMDPSLIDKELTCTVIKVSDSYLKLKTQKGNTYKFMLTGDTVYINREYLEKDATVVVTFDGMAADSPNVKIIRVTKTATKDAPIQNYKTVGVIKDIDGSFIELMDETTYIVDPKTCTIKGEAMFGGGATLIYHIDSKNGYKVCTKAIFTIPEN